MGGSVPNTLRMRGPSNGGFVGTLRDLEKTIDALGGARTAVLDYIRGGQNILGILSDIYRSADVPKAREGNATDLVGDQLPPGRDRDARRPQPTVGGGLKNPKVSIRLKDTKILPDFRTLTLFGEASATLEIATEYPAKFDTPTEINFKLTSTSISPSQIGVVGTATMYKVFHGDFKIQLHYDDRKLLEAIIRLAKERGLSRADVERLLESMSFDASAVVKAGFLPISFVKVSASSLLPLRRPLIGATEELLPVQLSSLPDREMFIGGAQVVSGGVFFDVPVPALGLHYSRYGREHGVSATAAGLAKPDLDNLGKVQTFGYVDLHYAKRVTNAVDLDVGITYTYSPSSDFGEPEQLQVQYMHARGKPWLPTSRDNQPAGADRSGHNFMFAIKGTFDLF